MAAATADKGWLENGKSSIVSQRHGMEISGDIVRVINSHRKPDGGKIGLTNPSK